MQLKIKVGKLLTLASRQSGEQALWNSRQICSELADIYQVLAVGIWCVVVFASDQIVFNDQRLTWAEVAGVVERYGFFGGDLGALHNAALLSVQVGKQTGNSVHVPL